MSISGISGISAYMPAGDAYVTEAVSNMQADLDKTDSLVEAIRNARSAEDPKAVMKACQAFESYFLQMMFKEMRRTVPDGTGVFAKSSAEKIFTDMLDEQMSILAADSGGIGLAAFMFKQMQREGTV